MRIFYSFLILLTAALLWLIPITQAIYDFRTDLRVDSFAVTTPVGGDNTTVALFASIYDGDIAAAGVTSNLSTDVPVLYSYTAATKAAVLTGLSANATHTLEVSYYYSALSGEVALDTFMDLTPYIWYLVMIAFPVAALAALFMGRT